MPLECINKCERGLIAREEVKCKGINQINRSLPPTLGGCFGPLFVINSHIQGSFLYNSTCSRRHDFNSNDVYFYKQTDTEYIAVKYID